MEEEAGRCLGRAIGRCCCCWFRGVVMFLVFWSFSPFVVVAEADVAVCGLVLLQEWKLGWILMFWRQPEVCLAARGYVSLFSYLCAWLGLSI